MRWNLVFELFVNIHFIAFVTKCQSLRKTRNKNYTFTSLNSLFLKLQNTSPDLGVLLSNTVFLLILYNPHSNSILKGINSYLCISKKSTIF